MSLKSQALNQQNKLEAWSKRIFACRDSGQNVQNWCRDNNICEAHFTNGEKSVEIVSHEPTYFAEVMPLVIRSTVAVTVRIAGVEVDIYSGVDAETVETVLRILRSC